VQHARATAERNLLPQQPAFLGHPKACQLENALSPTCFTVFAAFKKPTLSTTVKSIKNNNRNKDRKKKRLFLSIEVFPTKLRHVNQISTQSPKISKINTVIEREKSWKEQFNSENNHEYTLLTQQQCLYHHPFSNLNLQEIKIKKTCWTANTSPSFLQRNHKIINS